MSVIAEKNTRFALAIIHPKTKAIISAETLYNDCCAAMGHTVRDHVSDLVFDNLDYAARGTLMWNDDSEKALMDAVCTWSDAVHAEIGD